MPHKGFHSMDQHLGMQTDPADTEYEIRQHRTHHMPQNSANIIL
jgi:hypothetical protein